MMANLIKFSCMVAVIMCMVLVTAPKMTHAAISCGQVFRVISPCVSYLTNGVARRSAACCNGVKNLNNMAKSTAARRAVCSCLKSAAASISGLNPNKAASLPSTCGVRLPYKISTSINCARIR